MFSSASSAAPQIPLADGCWDRTQDCQCTSCMNFLLMPHFLHFVHYTHNISKGFLTGNGSHYLSFFSVENGHHIQHSLIQRQYAMYHITVLHTITSLCSIPLLSEGGALCTLLFSAENSMPRTTLLKHFLFIYLLFNSIMQYPTLLEHYASQRIFLAIRVHSHIILSIKNKKYTAFRFTAEFLLTGNSIPRSSVTICTGILSHYNTTPDRVQFTLYSTSSPRIRIYHIFSSVLAISRNTAYRI